MCPMCIGTATLVLSGGGSAGGAALVLGCVTGRKRLGRALRALLQRIRL